MSLVCRKCGEPVIPGFICRECWAPNSKNDVRIETERRRRPEGAGTIGVDNKDPVIYKDNNGNKIDCEVEDTVRSGDNPVTVVGGGYIVTNTDNNTKAVDDEDNRDVNDSKIMSIDNPPGIETLSISNIGILVPNDDDDTLYFVFHGVRFPCKSGTCRVCFEVVVNSYRDLDQANNSFPPADLWPERQSPSLDNTESYRYFNAGTLEFWDEVEVECGPSWTRSTSNRFLGEYLTSIIFFSSFFLGLACDFRGEHRAVLILGRGDFFPVNEHPDRSYLMIDDQNCFLLTLDFFWVYQGRKRSDRWKRLVPGSVTPRNNGRRRGQSCGFVAGNNNKNNYSMPERSRPMPHHMPISKTLKSQNWFNRAFRSFRIMVKHSPCRGNGATKRQRSRTLPQSHETCRLLKHLPTHHQPGLEGRGWNGCGNAQDISARLKSY